MSLPSTILVPGAIYRFCGIARGVCDDGSPLWVYPPADYRFVGVALDYRTEQERIVYVGVGGKDDGRYFVAGWADWLRDFTRVQSFADLGGHGNMPEQP